MDTSKKARANSVKHAAFELTSLADIQSVLSHAKLLLGNSHKLFSPNSTFQEKSQKNIVAKISTACVYYLPCPTKKTLTLEDILIEDQTFLVNYNCSDQIPVGKSECETQVPPNCPLWPINDPKEQYRSGYRLSKRQWNHPVNYPVGQAPQKLAVFLGVTRLSALFIQFRQPLPLLRHKM